MNELRFSCPVCGQHFIGPAEYIGQRIACPSCDKEFTLADPRSSTNLRLESHLTIAAPSAQAHGAPIAPEAQAQLDAARVAAQAQLSKTARLTQFIVRLMHHKTPPPKP